MVISWDSLCPPFTSAPNCNIFQSHLVSNSLLMASNTCANSPHLSTLLATISRIAFVINCPIGIICMPLMLASWQWHHSGSLILSMIAFAKSVTWILRFSNPINLQHLQHILKLLSMGRLARGFPTMPNEFAPWTPIKNSRLFDSLSTIPCSSTTFTCHQPQLPLGLAAFTHCGRYTVNQYLTLDCMHG